MYFPPPPPFFTLARAFLPLPLQLCSRFQHHSSPTTHASGSQSCPGGKSRRNIRMAHALLPQTLPVTLEGLQVHSRHSFFIDTSCKGVRRGLIESIKQMATQQALTCFYARGGTPRSRAGCGRCPLKPAAESPAPSACNGDCTARPCVSSEASFLRMAYGWNILGSGNIHADLSELATAAQAPLFRPALIWNASLRLTWHTSHLKFACLKLGIAIPHLMPRNGCGEGL